MAIFQFSARILVHLPLELGIIPLCRLYRRNTKDGVKPRKAQFLLDFFDRLDVFGRNDVRYIRERVERVAPFVTVSFSVEIFQNIPDDLADAFGGEKRLLPVDIGDLLVVYIRLLVHRLDIVDAERQNVSVVDGVDDGIGVQLCAERLLGRFEITVLCPRVRVGRKDRRSRKAEQVILLKRPCNGDMHIAELTAVALVKDNDDVLFKDGVPLIFLDEHVQLLYCGDDDPRIRVLQLLFENGGGGVAVGRTFFKAVVFLHSLVVEVLPVDHKQNLVNIRERGGQLRRFERGQRLAAAALCARCSRRRQAYRIVCSCGKPRSC